MPAPAKTVAGFPSMTAAAVGLRCQGKTTREIAEIIKRPVDRVIALERAFEKRSFRQSAPPVGAIRMARVSDYFADRHLAKLRPEAEARGCSVEMLIKTLVRTIADEGIVDYVLGPCEAAS